MPRLEPSGLQYVGGFRLPAGKANGVDFSFGGPPLAFNPATNGLFAGSYGGALAEVSIPTPVNSSDVKALPFATFLQPFADPTEGHLKDVATSGVMMQGLLVSGTRLYGTAAIFYDANNDQHVSHYSRSVQLNQPSFSGWSQVGESGKSGYVSGWMAAVPSEWQGELGGAALTGQCCIPIVWRTSVGPSAFAFNPAQIGKPQVSASPLLLYTLQHPTLGPWEGSNPTYGATTSVTGMVLIAGTRTVLYVGTNGLGPNCYGNGTANQSLAGTHGTDGALLCYDPVNSDKGSHAYPYRYQIWAYDLNDFAAVKAGAKQPWEVVPYGVWPLSFPTSGNVLRLSGLAYDAQQQRLFIAQRGADADGYAYRPVIHVFHVNAAPSPATPSPKTVSTVSLTSSKPAPQPTGTAITFTAQPSGGVAPYQYKWLLSDGVTTTVAADWTASHQFTWTPATANSKYVVSVWVRSAGNVIDALEASTSAAFAIASAPTTGPVTSVTLVANRAAPQPPMTAITWTATPVGGTAPHQYKWLVFDGVTTSVAVNWSTTNAFTWTPSTANANYRVEVWVRSAGNTADAKEASASSTFPIATVATAVSSVALTANKTEPQQPGTAINWNAVPSGGTASLLYKWFVFDGSTWNVVANWNASAAFAWTPATANANYRVRVWVKGASNTADQPEAAADKAFRIVPASAPAPTPPPTASFSAVTLTASKPSPQPPGTSIVFTAQAIGGVAPYQYQWWTFDNQKWTAVGGWTGLSTLTWSRNTADPQYQVQVRVRSAGSTSANGEATATLPYVLKKGS